MKTRTIKFIGLFVIPAFFTLLVLIGAISRDASLAETLAESIATFIGMVMISAGYIFILILPARVRKDRKKLNKAIENNNVEQVKNILKKQDKSSIKTLLISSLADWFCDIDNFNWGYWNNKIETPISVAYRKQNSAAFELLKNIPAEEAHTPLFSAIANKDKSLVDFLLKHGADVNAQDKDGWTALMEATCVGNKEIIELLLNNGADVSIEDNEGGTVFDVAKDDILDFLENYQKNRSMVPNRQANPQTSSADDKHSKNTKRKLEL